MNKEAVKIKNVTKVVEKGRIEVLKQRKGVEINLLRKPSESYLKRCKDNSHEAEAIKNTEKIEEESRKILREKLTKKEATLEEIQELLSKII
jgi:hypothetical protein